MKKLLILFSLIPCLLFGQLDITKRTVTTDTVKGRVDSLYLKGNISLNGKNIYTSFTDFTTVIDSVNSILVNLDSVLLLSQNEKEYLAGLFYNNSETHFPEFHMDAEGVKMSIGGELYRYGQNVSTTGSTNGKCFRVVGSTGQSAEFDLSGCSEKDSARVDAVCTHDIPINDFGFFTIIGDVNGINNPYTAGDSLFLGYAGGLVDTLPMYPLYAIGVATSIYSHAVNGKIAVDIDRIYENHPTGSLIYVNGNQEFASSQKLQFYDDTLRTENLIVNDTAIVDLIEAHSTGGFDGGQLVAVAEQHSISATSTSADNINVLSLNLSGVLNSNTGRNILDINNNTSGGSVYEGNVINVDDNASFAVNNNRKLLQYNVLGTSRLTLNPRAYSSVPYYFGSENSIGSGYFLQLRNLSTNILTVDYAGNVNIPSGSEYRVNGVAIGGGTMTASQINDSLKHRITRTFNDTIKHDYSIVTYNPCIMTGNVTVIRDTTNKLDEQTSSLAITSDGSSSLNLSAYRQARGSLNYSPLTDVTYYILFYSRIGKYWYNIFDTIRQDVTPPYLLSATVEADNPDSLVLVFSEAVNITTTGFSLSGDTITLSSVGNSGTSSPYFLLGDSLLQDSIYTLSYNSVTGSTVDLSDNALVSFTDSSVTNNILSYNPNLLNPFYYSAQDYEYTGSNFTDLGDVYSDVELAGSFEVSVAFTLTDGQVTGGQAILGTRFNNDRFILYVTATGEIGISISDNSATTTVIATSAASYFTDGANARKVINIRNTGGVLICDIDGVNTTLNATNLSSWDGTDTNTNNFYTGAYNSGGTPSLYMTGTLNSLFMKTTNLTSGDRSDLLNYQLNE